MPASSMPTRLRWFAEHQPFTPVIETLRALLGDHAVGSSLPKALVWSAVIALAGYLWPRRRYTR